MLKLLPILLVTCLTLLSGCTGLQQSLLFYPTHYNGDNGLTAWKQNEK